MIIDLVVLIILSSFVIHYLSSIIVSLMASESDAKFIKK